MKYFTLIILLGILFIRCEGNKSKADKNIDNKSWIYKNLKKEELLSNTSDDLIDRAAFHYQSNILKWTPPKSQMNNNDIQKVINFSKNTKKLINVYKINDYFSIIEGLDFDSGGDLRRIKNIWEFKDNKWDIYLDSSRKFPFDAYEFYLFDIDGDFNKELILKKDCCDTSEILIYRFESDGRLSNIYSNTLYGEEYEIKTEDGEYLIYIKNQEGIKELFELKDTSSK